MAGFVNREETYSGKPSPASRNIVTKALKLLSSFGMMYDDMVLRNSKAIGVNEDMYGWKLDSTNAAGGEYDDYALFANLSMSDINLRKSISIVKSSAVTNLTSVTNLNTTRSFCRAT